MRLSIKLLSNGSVHPLQLPSDANFSLLKSKIVELAGSGNFTIAHGSSDLSADDDVPLSALDLVDGDRLFVSMTDGSTPPATTATSTAKKPSPKVEKSEAMETFEQVEEDSSPSGVELRDRASRLVRDYFDDSGFSNVSLSTWDSPPSSSLLFSLRRPRKGVPLHKDQLSVMSTVVDKPSPTLIVNVSRIADNSLHLVHSFSVHFSKINVELISGLGEALTKSHVGDVSLPQLFQIPLIRGPLLNYLSTKDVARLSSTNHLTSSALKSQQVDVSFWRRRLATDFGGESLPSTSGMSYRSQYMDKANAKKQRERDRLRMQLEQEEHPLMVPPRHRPPPIFDPFNPFPEPPSPTHPHRPHMPFPGPDPLNPVNPRGPEGYIPHAPRVPWDPLSGGELAPSRAPPSHRPRQLGAPPHNPFNSFDRSDFI